MLVAVPSQGQDDSYPRVEFFAGPSAAYIHRHGFAGVQMSITGNFRRSVGLSGDLGIQSAIFGETTYQILFGPRFFKRGSNVTGFLHALSGIVFPRGGQDPAFTTGLGGGMDVRVGSRVAIRLLQADYLPTRSSGRWFHNGRAALGVVFAFGRR
jgi:hypothetical protein